jgi:hypothetical protein
MRGLFFFLFLMMTLAVTSCTSSTGTISGKVYYKGVLLKGGNVTFLTKDKKVSRLAEIQEDGSYEIEKMPLGEAQIAINTAVLRPMQNTRRNVPPKGVEPPAGYQPPDFAETAKRYVPIPPQYADPDKAGLTYTVLAGKQVYDIQLK